MKQPVKLLSPKPYTRVLEAKRSGRGQWMDIMFLPVYKCCTMFSSCSYRTLWVLRVNNFMHSFLKIQKELWVISSDPSVCFITVDICRADYVVISLSMYRCYSWFVAPCVLNLMGSRSSVFVPILLHQTRLTALRINICFI